MQILRLAPWITVALYASGVSAGILSNLVARQYGGYNLTEDVLGVDGAISQPTCNATEPCIQLHTIVIPRCLKLRGDAGCWCGNHDPVHYCALCMSNPSDNTTTPDQTQQATNSHARFHGGCAAFEAFINGTSGTTSSSSSALPSTTSLIATQANSNSDSSSKSNTGAIIGGAVGGIVGLAIIGAICFLAYQYMKRKQPDDATLRPMSMASPSLKYTSTPPPLMLPGSVTQNGGQYGQFGMQQAGHNPGATYGTPLPYTGSPPTNPTNPPPQQRESVAQSYDSRML